MRRCTATILDDIGAMAGFARAAGRKPHSFLKTDRVKESSTSASSSSKQIDALRRANGMAITWCELDEGFRNACAAGAVYCCRAPRGVGGARKDGRRTACALAVAYEVTTRFALALPFRSRSIRMRPGRRSARRSGVVARGHDAKTMAAAVTGAATMTFAGLFDTAGRLAGEERLTSAGAWTARAQPTGEAGSEVARRRSTMSSPGRSAPA